MSNRFITNTDFASISSMSLTSVIVKSDTDKDFRINFEPSYSGFENFVFFGSAEAITNNAINKIIDTYPINTTGATASEFLFEQSQKYVNIYSPFERKVLEGFTTSITGTYNGEPISIINLRRNSDGSLYNINDVNYIESMLEDSKLYDHHNKNILQGFVPYQLVEYDENDVLANTMNMFGNVMDEVLQYTSQFGNLFNVTNNYSEYDKPRAYDSFNLLTLFGFKVHTNFLFSTLINYLVKTSTRFSEKAIQTQIWDRVLANLIYIYKTKGTFECFKAFLQSIGLNVDLIDINEYVYYDRPAYIKTTKVINYFELLFDDSASGNISSSSSALNLSGLEWSIVFKFDLKGKIQSQNLFGNGIYGLSVINTSTTSDYGEVNVMGHFSFTGVTSSGTIFGTNTADSPITYSKFPKTVIVSKSDKNLQIEVSHIDNANNIITQYSNIFTSVFAFVLPVTSSPFYLGRGGNDNYNSFVGSAINFKVFNRELSIDEKNKHHRQIEMINLADNTVSSSSVILNWELNEPLYDKYRQNNFDSITSTDARIILDSASGFATGTVTGTANFLNGSRYVLQQIVIPTEKYVSGLVIDGDKVNIEKPLYRNTNWVSITTSPVKSLNNAFEYVLGPIDFYDYFLSIDLTSNSNKYKGLENLRKLFYSTGVTVRGYEALISDVEDYAVGLFKSFYQFLPATARLLYMGLLIESPIYDRNKHIIRNAEFDTITHKDQSEEITHSLEEYLVKPLTSNTISVTSIVSNLITAGATGNINVMAVSGFAVSSLTGTYDYGDTIADFDYNNTISEIESNDIIMDYIKNSKNEFSSFDAGDDIVSPIDVSVADNFDIILEGHQIIYLSRSLTGQTSLVIKYLDDYGDNIIGTKFKITQNITENKSKLSVIDLDSGVTSNNKSQNFSMLDYNGSNLIFRFINTIGAPSTSEYEIIKNYLIVKDRVKEFDIKIKWIPDIGIVYTPFNILDTVSVVSYPIIRWNLTTDIGSITATYSDLGGLSSSQFTTSADFVAGSGVNILFNNYSTDKDGEISIKFTVSGQQDLFVLDKGDIADEFQQVGSELPLGGLGYESLIYSKNALDIKKFRLPANKTAKLTLRLTTTSVSAITAYTSGDVRFFTNQPLDNIRNKIFRIRFIAIPSSISADTVPSEKT